MNKYTVLHAIFFLVFSIFSNFVMAQDVSDEAQEEQQRQENQEERTFIFHGRDSSGNDFSKDFEVVAIRLINEVEDNAESFVNDQERFYAYLDDELSSIIDFDTFTRRVSSRYTRSLNDEQKNLFREQVKRKVFDSYIRIFESEDLRNLSDGLEIHLARNLRYTNRDETRAFQDLRIIKNQTTYNVTFSVEKDIETSKWRIVNLIVEGVNIGLNYRNQFNQLMENNQGDFNRTLENWSSIPLENGS